MGSDFNRAELLRELENLRVRLDEAEETLRAIGSGEVDAIVVSGAQGEQIFTLQGAEYPYRVLVETMNEGAATLSLDGTILYCNHRMGSLLEVRAESLLGTPFVAHVAAADRDFFLARMNSCTMGSYQNEISLVTGTGTVIPAMVSCCALDLPGERGISLIITDLRQQKRNEECMVAERLARSIIDQVGEVIIVCDEKGVIIRASRLAHRICAANPLLQPFAELIGLTETATGKPIVISPSAPQVVKNVEVEFRRHDGRIYFFQLNVSPLMDGRSGIIGFIVTLVDITERLKIKEQLVAMNETLEHRVEQRTRQLQETQLQYLHAEKLAAIGQFSASIVHEFNNPLQVIITILKSLKQTIDLKQEDAELLGAAVSETERMKSLIRNLQEFNRPSAGRQVAMDVHSAIDSLLLFCKSDFKHRKIAVVRDYAAQLPSIMAIPDQIKQVFLNLLTNAADACGQAGGMITISTRLESSRVTVAIKDNGPGIVPEHQAVIFQPFFTTKPASQGTGLGLSVSQSIVRDHLGEIRVDSEPAKGATFTVLLPVGKEKD